MNINEKYCDTYQALSEKTKVYIYINDIAECDQELVE